MRSSISWLTTVALVLLGTSVLRADDEKILNIGDPPPAMAISSWVKGDKVEKFEPGKTYVVEFWATWCGPCRASIPHLTELAHKYNGRVRVVGVDAFEDDPTLVEPFVKEMGDKMNYAVALDTIPEGKGKMDGLMGRSWMDAAEQHGIPTAFVIHDGKIAWIGHPIQMDAPLEKLLAGDWDYATSARDRLADRTEYRKLQSLGDKVDTPLRAKDYKAAIAVINEIVKDDPTMATALSGKKFVALCLDGQTDDALKVGQQAIEDRWGNTASLNAYCWDVVDPDLKEVNARIARLAVKACERAVELTKGEDAMILDTLAVAQFRAHEVDKAIATEEKAIAVEKARKETSDSDIKLYVERIDWFRKQAKDYSN